MTLTRRPSPSGESAWSGPGHHARLPLDGRGPVKRTVTLTLGLETGTGTDTRPQATRPAADHNPDNS
ncbi:MAG: hypothetical protein WCK58_00095 [Chloroflexota bacterium]